MTHDDALDHDTVELDDTIPAPMTPRAREFYGHVGFNPNELRRFRAWANERHARMQAARAATLEMWESTRWMR